MSLFGKRERFDNRITNDEERARRARLRVGLREGTTYSWLYALGLGGPPTLNSIPASGGFGNWGFFTDSYPFPKVYRVDDRVFFSGLVTYIPRPVGASVPGSFNPEDGYIIRDTGALPVLFRPTQITRHVIWNDLGGEHGTLKPWYVYIDDTGKIILDDDFIVGATGDNAKLPAAGGSTISLNIAAIQYNTDEPVDP